MNKSQEIIKREIQKLRRKASDYLYRSEVFNKKADELEEELKQIQYE